MRQAFLFILWLLCSQVQAQYSKYIISFTNKANNSFSLSTPAKLLSPRALDRRLRQNISIDSADLPVSRPYEDSVHLAGNVTILSRSRWLNQVLIQTTDANALTKIRKLPFVASTRAIGNKQQPSVRTDSFAAVLQPPPLLLRTTGSRYNYGNSANQVQIHEGGFLHNKGFTGANIHIAVLDAGFLHYKSVTAFDSVRQNGQLLGEKDFVAFDNSVIEDDIHGMYCLSIMAANWPGRMVGTAPGASYWLLRTENAATEYPVEEHNWVVAAEFADSAGADLISSSLGYFDFDDPGFNHSYADFYKNTTTVTRGATIAAKKGLIVMNSAGNEGNSNWKYIGFPADADSVCAVGAVDGQGRIAGFSSYGYPGKVKPNIVSVGVGTVLAGLNNQPTAGNGTSYANPNVAGLVACLWQAFPNLSNMKILDAVYRSADRYTQPDNRFGYGIPNFKTAWELLKKEENTALFGPDWLWVGPNPFTTQIDVKLIGQINGATRLQLISPTGSVLATVELTTENLEVYDTAFSNLDSLAGGRYLIRYTDSINTRTIPVLKDVPVATDWLRVYPGTGFGPSLTVTVIPDETGQAALQIIDAQGRMVALRQLKVVAGQVQTVRFGNLAKLAHGPYVLLYRGVAQKRTIRLIKLQ